MASSDNGVGWDVGIKVTTLVLGLGFSLPSAKEAETESTRYSAPENRNIESARLAERDQGTRATQMPTNRTHGHLLVMRIEAPAKRAVTRLRA